MPAYLCSRLINPHHKKQKLTCMCGSLPYDTHWPTCEPLLRRLETQPPLQFKIRNLMHQLKLLKEVGQTSRLIMCKSPLLLQADKTLVSVKNTLYRVLVKQ